jgi:centromere/kinetochore protein ZW10
VGNSEVLLPTSAIFSSLSTTSLTTHLNILRQGLISHYIERLIQKPISITISCTDAIDPEVKFTLSSSLSDAEKLIDRLQSLSAFLLFLNKNLFPHLRASNQQDFPKLLCQPITKALLERLLLPSIPSSFAALPPFLDLVQCSVDFEEKYLVQLLGNSPQDRPIKEWADGVNGQYERKRRVDLLDEARALLRRDGMPQHTFRAEHHQNIQPETPVNSTANGTRNHDKVLKSDDESHIETDESAWGFDAATTASQQGNETPQQIRTQQRDSEDPSDAWGLDDDEESWDDPWDDTRVSFSKESYLVSARTRDIISVVGRILQEAKELLTSNIFLSASSPPGTMLSQAALSPLDLFRALYPVTFAADLSFSPAHSMRFSNDCIYLSIEVGKMSTSHPDLIALKDRWREYQDHLKSLGDSFFEDNLVSFLRHLFLPYR